MGTMRERVAAGVAWLDANVPGWVDRIDLDRLHMEDCVSCMLGQLYGDYENAPYEAIIEPAFTTSIGERTNPFPSLTREWKRVIRERRAS